MPKTSRLRIFAGILKTLKALYRGTGWILRVFERMSKNGFPSFGEYWAGLDGHGGTSRHPNCWGNGYKVGSKEKYTGLGMDDLAVLEHEELSRVVAR